MLFTDSAKKLDKYVKESANNAHQKKCQILENRKEENHVPMTTGRRIVTTRLNIDATGRSSVSFVPRVGIFR